MIRYGKLKSLIFESTLVTAVFTAICFLLGDVAHQRLAVQLGVPRHLLHKPAPQVIIANGSLYILFLLLIFLLLWAFVFVLFKYLPQKFVISTKENLKNRYLKHTIFYKLFMVLSIAILIIIFPFYVPIETPYQRKMVYPVKDIKLNNNIEIQCKNLQFICRKERILLFKCSDLKEYIIVKEDDLRLLVFEPAN